MTPFQQFVVKVHSRCNLACSYCYVYKMADQTWRAQPHRMSPYTVEMLIRRIADHVRDHGLARIAVILHGGEPLLAGRPFLAGLAEGLRSAVPAEIELVMQTNGTLLDEPMLEALAALRIRCGVSLDGGAESNDRHRRYADGRGSHSRVAQALRLLEQQRFRTVYDGILCTIDLSVDPVDCYESLLGFAPPALDLLLPHGTWSNPPPGLDPSRPGTPYADWLLKVFDRWYGAPRQETRLRLFIEIIQLLLGGPGALEGLGLRPSTVIVIDTDGAIKHLDSLSAAYSGAAETGLNVREDSFDAALNHPLTIARQGGLATLSETCQACREVRVCGGGLFPHRYKAGHGFKNTSVYCRDLLALITGIRRRISRDLPAA
jgi:uncharacterized protein